MEKVKPTPVPVFQINTNFALTGRNGAQEADAQVPYQLRLQNARRTVRAVRLVRARQDGERGGWDGKKEITVTNCLKLPFASEYRKAGLVWRPA